MSKCHEFDLDIANLDIANLDIADLDKDWFFSDLLDMVVVGLTRFVHKKLDIFGLSAAAANLKTRPDGDLCGLRFIFLDASSHLYKSVCPSVGPSVRPSVRPSACNAFVKNA